MVCNHPEDQTLIGFPILRRNCAYLKKANEKYGAYDNQLKTKERLLKKTLPPRRRSRLIKQIESEQGNMSIS